MGRDFNATTSVIDCGSGSTLDNIWDGGGSVFVSFVCDSFGESPQGNYISKFAGSAGWAIQNDTDTGTTCEMNLFHDWSGNFFVWVTNTDPIIYGNVQTALILYNADAVGNNPTIYVDGVSHTVGSGLVESSTATGARVDDAANTLTIGALNTGPDRSFDGILRNAVIWNTILSANEASALNNGVNPFAIRPGNIVMNQPIWGNQSPEPDYSGNGNTGTESNTSKAINGNTELIENYL